MGLGRWRMKWSITCELVIRFVRIRRYDTVYQTKLYLQEEFYGYKRPRVQR